MGNEQGQGGRQVTAVEISCNILEALLELDESGVTELADHLGYSKATVHGHLATLYENEFVVKNEGTYQLSLRFLDFSEQIKDETEIYDIAREETEELAEQSGEFAQFMVEEHGWGVYLHKAMGERAVKSASYTGHRKHLHCTAIGKAILSQVSSDRVNEIIDRHGLPEYTENTITDPEALFDELESIRERGFAYDNDEVLPGLRCVATPVTATDGELLGSISISGPSSRMHGEFFEEKAPKMLKDASNVIGINASQL